MAVKITSDPECETMGKKTKRWVAAPDQSEEILRLKAEAAAHRALISLLCGELFRIGGDKERERFLRTLDAPSVDLSFEQGGENEAYGRELESAMRDYLRVMADYLIAMHPPRGSVERR
jgi:hypothetical protein